MRHCGAWSRAVVSNVGRSGQTWPSRTRRACQCSRNCAEGQVAKTCQEHYNDEGCRNTIEDLRVEACRGDGFYRPVAVSQGDALSLRVLDPGRYGCYTSHLDEELSLSTRRSSRVVAAAPLGGSRPVLHGLLCIGPRRITATKFLGERTTRPWLGGVPRRPGPFR